MGNPATTRTRYVCIHGHFYQPPRENPWLEQIEREESATPNHDWNERIDAECYRANTAARLVDDRNRILTLHSNYQYLNFNFGPTLLRWLEQHDPWVYRAIIEADRESCRRFGGHGNAMAQAYNHLIMPLANRRDKITQVLWGLRDFESRFGRRPEGMWLPETAVDRETLEIMAEAGIRFTILSPFQAARWRELDKDPTWHDARGGIIPTGRAYRYSRGGGKSILVFFYDASLAKGIAFERLLEHSSRLVGQINAAHEHRYPADSDPWLVHTATDGESYGHHFKFGDMALAAALQELRRDPTTQIVNYATFLDSFPVRAEVEILDNTAWSCAHGVGRWERDCGCHIGGGPGWSQKWRTPLRQALNFLRDALAEHYQKEMGKLVKDPWAVRNAYVEVLLDPEYQKPVFARQYLRPELGAAATPRFYQLLEMQRCSMSMFTSCGWFFDDVSGLETVIILRYAARAIQLAEETGGPALEADFLKILEKAPANTPEYTNGADVYLKKARPEVVRKDRVLANYVIQTITHSSRPLYRTYCFDVSPQREENLGAGPVPCLYGHARVKDNRTLEEEDYLYAVLHFGGLDFRCSVKPFRGEKEYEAILKDLQCYLEEQKTVEVIRTLDRAFGEDFFSLHEVFRDLRAGIALEISRKMLTIYTDLQRHLYQAHRPLILSLKQWGIRIPPDLRGAIRRVLFDELHQVVLEILAHEREPSQEIRPWKDDTDFSYRAHMGRLHSLLEDAKSWGLTLQPLDVASDLGHAMVDVLTAFRETFAPQHAGRLYRLVKVCRDLSAKPEAWKLQTLYFELVGTAVKKPGLISRIQNFEGLLQELDAFLDCRFARFFGPSPEPFP